MALLTTYYPQFFTATILDWKPLLKEDKYKDIIVSSIKFLVDNKRVKVFSFVIMPNHLHIIWQIQPSHKREDVQRDFLKYTAQKIRFDLVENNPELLKDFEVVASDRKYPLPPLVFPCGCRCCVLSPTTEARPLRKLKPVVFWPQWL